MTIVHDRLKNIQYILEGMDTLQIKRSTIEPIIFKEAGGSASTILNYLKLLKMQRIIEEVPNTRGNTFVILANKEKMQAQLDEELVEKTSIVGTE